MSEKRFDFSIGTCKIYDKEEERLLEDTEVCGLLNEQLSIIRRDELSMKTMMSNIEKLEKENEQLRNELQFYDKIINFFASNTMTKYSSKAELLEEMKIFEKNGWL